MAHLDATELLRNQHREAQAVFALFEETPESETRRQMAEVLVKKLSIHAAIEELVFYPAIRHELPGGEALYNRSLTEHQELKELLVELDRAIRHNEVLRPYVEAIRTAVETHAAEEESEVFPAARRALGRERLAELGDELTQSEAAAPSRAHPHAPAQPPLNRVADAAAGMLDKARDALAHRP